MELLMMSETEEVDTAFHRYKFRFWRVREILDSLLSIGNAEHHVVGALAACEYLLYVCRSGIYFASQLTCNHSTGHVTYGNRSYRPSRVARLMAAMQILRLPSSPW
jgi:hypothetical protein